MFCCCLTDQEIKAEILILYYILYLSPDLKPKYLNFKKNRQFQMSNKGSISAVVSSVFKPSSDHLQQSNTDLAENASLSSSHADTNSISSTHSTQRCRVT